MTDLIECHVCHSKDTLQNLMKVKFVESGGVVYAHPRCVERHNKDANKNLRALDASMLADEIFEHDIDATDQYVVEQFLRERKYSKNYLSGPCPSVAEINAAARETRDRNAKQWVFEQIEENTKAWPAEANEAFVAETAEALRSILYRMADDNWRSNGVIEEQAVRLAAQLLIQQVAWRKHDAEFREAAREYEEGSDDVACA